MAVDTRAPAGWNDHVVVVSVWWARLEEGGGAALLQAAVGHRAGCPPSDVVVGRLCPGCASTGHGRPVVLAPSPGRWRVTLSRAPGIVAVGVADGEEVGEVGLDVEQVARTAFAGFPAVALHPLELDGSPAERALVWTRKEAVLKATGLGLRTDPRAVRVSHPGNAPTLLAGVGIAAGQRVWLTDIGVPAEYAATLAVIASAAGAAPGVDVREVSAPAAGAPVAAPGAWAGAANDGRGRRDPGRSAPLRRR